MMKRRALAVLFSVLLLLPALALLPVATADVYIPPGPPRDMSEWIFQGLHVYDLQWPCCEPIWCINQLEPIGWKYTDGPHYDPRTQIEYPKVHFELEGRTTIPFSTWVMVFGYIPGVVVSPDQTPPPIVLTITWNGVPYAVTLEAPGPVGFEYPPVRYGEPVPHVPEGIRDQLPCIETVYPWVYPTDGGPDGEWKKAYYNVWWGDFDCPDGKLPFGLYFWYIFHPNVGDWIAYDCFGMTKHPPTYDITALLEYSTMAIWLNHKCFDVRLLEVHKEIEPDFLIGPFTQAIGEVSNILTITNVGKVPAPSLDFWESFPVEPKKALVPKWDTATIKIHGYMPEGRNIAMPLPLRESLIENGWPFKLPPPFDVLYPGETMVIAMEFSVNVDTFFYGTMIVDAMVSCCYIPPWKYPRALDALIFVPGVMPLGIQPQYQLSARFALPPSMPPLPPPILVEHGNPFYPHVFCFEEIDRRMLLVDGTIPANVLIYCPRPVNRNPIPQYRCFAMILDPPAVDLNDDGVIDAQDVELVRQAIIGLIPYDTRMDTNVNNKVDTQDLAAFKLAAS